MDKEGTLEAIKEGTSGCYCTEKPYNTLCNQEIWSGLPVNTNFFVKDA